VRRLSVLLLLLLAAGPGVARAETVHLIPDRSAGWSMRNVFAALRFGHYHGERKLEIDSTPPGASIDLFYVRSGFQLRYEQAEAPVTVVLPSRINASTKDSVMIRASLDGYRQVQQTVRVSSKQSVVQLDLDPLPNSLEVVSHTYFAGRGSLSFLTREALTLRMQDAHDGFTVVLTQTANTPEAAEALRGIRSPFIVGIEPQQLGEDLLLEVALSPHARGDVDLRSRQSHDAIRRLYSYTIDLQPADGGAEAVARAQAVLAGIGPADVMGCAVIYDSTLRKLLDPEALARALTPTGRFTDPYLRAAMKRLGEVSPHGVIALIDDTKLRPIAPIELSAAMSQAAQARGYLAILRALVAGLEANDDRRATLRSLIAPELSPSAFDAAVGRAEAQERRCREGA
jgi:hypothetical protein